MITISETAQEKIIELMDAKGLEGYALRIGINGRGPGGFLYQLQFVQEDDVLPEDTVVEQDEFKVLIDSQSAADLEGASLDFVEDTFERGFKLDNPNPLWRDPLAMKVQTVLDRQINPAIAGHGGFVSLLDVRDGTAFISFGGGCQGCGMVDVTLKQGVDVMIREAIPEIEQVVDTTNHSLGTNPYYQSTPGQGESPLRN